MRKKLDIVASILLLDGNLKSYRRKAEDQGLTLFNIQTAMFPNESKKNTTPWWFSAALEYNKLPHLQDKLVFWGSGRFFDSFLKEISQRDKSEPFFWSQWDRAIDRGYGRFDGSFGFFIPKDICSILGSIPEWIGNRFLYRHIFSKLAEKSIQLHRLGNEWPSVEEELNRKKGNNAVTLAMIVKDEERFLAGCIEQALPYVDEIVIVDTGSTDNSLEIARMYNAKIINHRWRNDFAAARNEYMNVINDRYILNLDADEFILPATGVMFRDLADRGEQKTYLINMYNYMLTIQYFFTDQLNPRLFYKNPGDTYEGIIHEQLKSDNVIEYLEGYSIVHYGYLPEVFKSKKKDQRNTSLFEETISVKETPFDLLNKGRELMIYNKPQEAIDTLMRYFEIQDKSLRKIFPSAYWTTANVLVQLKRYDEALEYADVACETELPIAYYIRAVTFEEMGEYDKAIADYEKAENASEGDHSIKAYNFIEPEIKKWKASFKAGQLYEKQNKFKEALEKYLGAHRGDNSNLNSLMGIARILKKTQRYTQALSWLDKALRLSENLLEALIEKIEILVLLNQDQQAFQLVEKYLKDKEICLPLFLKIAETAIGLGRTQTCSRALFVYMEICDNPTLTTRLVYARCLLEEEKATEAFGLLNIDLPDSATGEEMQEFYLLRGNAMLALGNTFEALDEYSLSFEKESLNPELFFKIALAMTTVDRLEDALYAFERLDEISPNYKGKEELLKLIGLKLKIADLDN